MVVAFAYCTAKYLKMFDDNNKRTLFSRPVGVACVIFAVVAIVVRPYVLSKSSYLMSVVKPKPLKTFHIWPVTNQNSK